MEGDIATLVEIARAGLVPAQALGLVLAFAAGLLSVKAIA